MTSWLETTMRELHEAHPEMPAKEPPRSVSAYTCDGLVRLMIVLHARECDVLDADIMMTRGEARVLMLELQEAIALASAE